MKDNAACPDCQGRGWISMTRGRVRPCQRVLGPAPPRIVGGHALTESQQLVYDWFAEFTEREGLPPTIREVAERFDFTVRAAYDYVHALVRKGYLVRRANARARDSRLYVVNQ